VELLLVRSRCSPSLASFVFGVLCGKRRTHNKAASTLYLRLIALKTVLSIQSFQSTLQASLDSARQRTVRSRLMKFEGGTLGSRAKRWGEAQRGLITQHHHILEKRIVFMIVRTVGHL
jgi:hypothetical protein